MMIDVIAAAHVAPHTVSTPAAQPGASYEEHYSKARALAAAGQHDLAIALYTGMLARSPGNADLLLGRGLAHARSKRYAEAENTYRTDLALHPASGWSLNGLEKALTGQGKLNHAQSAQRELATSWALAEPAVRAVQ